jgi:ligand-binding sensor domain-containing protein
MKLFFIFSTCFVLTLTTAFSADFRVDNWKSHTSLLDVITVAVDHKDRIWAGSSGGAFVYGKSDGSYKKFDNINAFLSSQITVIKAHKEREIVMLGTFDGYIEIFTPDEKWIHITDIYNQQFSNPIINDIQFLGDKAYIAGGFGLAVFDLNNMVFLETIKRYGNFPNQTLTNKILIDNNTIWLATDVGVAKAQINDQLANPAVWTNYDSQDGLYDKKILNLTSVNNIVYAMSERTVKKLQDDFFAEYIESPDQLTSISGFDNNVVYTNQFLMRIGANTINIKHPTLIRGFEIAQNVSEEPYFIFNYRDAGIGIYQNDTLIHYKPNSPITNSFRSLSVDEDGILWLATMSGATSRGFASYDGENWNNYTSPVYPVLKTNEYHKITARNGKVYASNWGAGIYIFDKKDTITEGVLYDRSNSVLVGLATSPDYIVVGKSEVDNKGWVWMACLGTISPGPSLVAISPDGKSYGFINKQSPNSRQFMTIGIDFYGTKWVGGAPVHGLGLLYYNENGTPDDFTDDVSEMLTTSQIPNLLENTHNCIAVDKLGTVWIGTTKGVAVIINPSAVLNNRNNLIVRSLARLLGEINVNDIVVDAQNNKWIATSDGVWVVDSDGASVLAYINSSNSPLPTNEVFALGYDGKFGKMFFSTRFGVYEATTLSVIPSDKYEIVCYPQPYDPNKDSEMVIDGLVEYSELKILTSDGSFVRRIVTGSKRTVWDGKDENGNVVNSGIFLVVATSLTTKETAVQKIAVVRKN